MMNSLTLKSFVGDETKPSVTADDQDKKNDTVNSEVEAQALARKEEARQSLPKFEEEIKGDSQKVKVVPQFKEIK
jgi:hypothetical protein